MINVPEALGPNHRVHNTVGVMFFFAFVTFVAQHKPFTEGIRK